MRRHQRQHAFPFIQRKFYTSNPLPRSSQMSHRTGTPRFFSLTLTAADSASLTLEKRLLSLFPDGGEDILLGKDGPEQVPITLDLRELPLESTGIVCGVASRLVDGMRGRFGGGSGGSARFEMSYLSTARAGHVVVFEDELEDAMESLQGIGEGED